MDLKNTYSKLNAIYVALNDLTVQGTKNCSIIGAIASTLESMAKELENEIKENEVQQDKAV